MDISGVMNAATQANKLSANPVTNTIQKKVEDVTVASVNELLNSVVHDSPEVPSDKLPAHLGRNFNETA